MTYVDRNFSGTIQSITRSACANSTFPANGMLYFTPTACGCTTMLRGHIALTPEPLGQPVDDSLRLEGGAVGDHSAASTRPFALPDSIIAQDWCRRQARAPGSETEPVTVNGRAFVAPTHEHQMQCRDSQGQVLWSFTAGGRISSPPVIYEALCLFGSHDGWVYAVRVGDGSLAWRFMAAPYERKMIANSQLESAWADISHVHLTEALPAHSKPHNTKTSSKFQQSPGRFNISCHKKRNKNQGSASAVLDLL